MRQLPLQAFCLSVKRIGNGNGNENGNANGKSRERGRESGSERVGVRGGAANLAYCGGLACSYNGHNLLNAQQEQTDRGDSL